ncbi:class I lanthipeptide [Emticicia sp. 17c]|uniref:class I lanthipeptide n=1 Tax=Emticicia sp. 17c TaxID=3127704 RepID=UPI00301CA4AC
MKKKITSNRLTLDKETIAQLNAEQLSAEQGQEVVGGATKFTGGASCCGPDTYTSCSR